MTKTILWSLSIVFLLLFQSCQKETLEQHKAVAVEAKVDFPTISVQNNILTFESIQAYTNIVDHEDYSITDALTKHALSLPFDAYSKSSTKSMDFDSDFIEAILNKDRVVKIGKWFVKINPKTQKVYALSDEFTHEYSLLVADNPQGRHIHQFTTDEDVIELLQNESLLNSRGLFCGESGASNHPFSQTRYFAFVPANSYPASRYEFPCKVTYLKLGIYYSLKAHMEVEKETRTQISPIATMSSYDYPDTHMRIFSYRKYKIRCGTEHGWYAKVTPIFDKELDYKSYQGSKRLSKYWMKIGFEAAFPGTGGYIPLWTQAVGAPYQREIKHGY